MKTPGNVNQSSIEIKTPCKENWETMTGDKNKRFCSKCQLNVIDFSTMPPSDIIDYLRNHQGQRICGRITKNDTSIWHPEIRIEMPDKRAAPNKLLYTFSLAAMLLASCNPAAPNKVETHAEIKSELLPSDTVILAGINETPNIDTPQIIQTEKKCAVQDKPKPISEKSPYQEIGIMGEIEITENDPHILYKMPQFPGGEAALTAYIQKNLQYPDPEIQSRVIIKFTIDTFGRVMDPEVVKTIPNGSKLDSAALELIRNMPLWIPGENIFGTKKPGSIHLPIRFILRE